MTATAACARFRHQFAIHRILRMTIASRSADARRQAIARELVGTVLNETYRIDAVLGTGGMGCVVEAHHTRLPKRFAIKLLRNDLTSPEAALRRFEREATVTSLLGHPHIVEVVDFNLSQDGRPFLVMELLQGEDLTALIQRAAPLDLASVGSIVRQCAGALQAAHDSGVVHRDLKPSNIFLCHRGSRNDYVKLLDFGISKVMGLGNQLTGTVQSMGTPSYMSPEQASGRSAEVDPRTDIFALGTITYEMLTGRAPFIGNSPPEVMYQIVHVAESPLVAQRPGISTELDNAVRSALSKRPQERPQSIVAFAEAVFAACEIPEDRLPTEDRSPQNWPQSISGDAESRRPSNAIGDDAHAAVLGADVSSNVAPSGDVNIRAEARSFATVAKGSDAGAPNNTATEQQQAGPLRPSYTQPYTDLDAASEKASSTDLVGWPPPARRPLTRAWGLATLIVLLLAAVAWWLLSRSGDPQAPRPLAAPLRSDMQAGLRTTQASQHNRTDLRPDKNATAAATQGRRLWLDVGVEGARVSLNGRRLGISPLRAVLIPATGGQILASRAGYAPFRYRVPNGDQDIHIQGRMRRLTIRSPSVDLRIVTTNGSDPLWAEVFVDGRPVGQSTLSVKVRPGKHLIEARREGFRVARRRIRVRPGRAQTVVLLMKSTTP